MVALNKYVQYNALDVTKYIRKELGNYIHLSF